MYFPVAFKRNSAFNVVGAGLLIVASTFGLSRYTYGLFVPAIRHDFNLDQATVGAIGSASYLGYLVATLASPLLVRRFSPRLPIIVGGMTATLGMLLVGLAGNPLWLALGVTLAGCSPGLAYPPLSDAIKQLCHADKQSRYYAIINSGTSFGVMVSGPLALFAGPRWQLAWLCFAFIALMATLWNVLIMPGERRETANDDADSVILSAYQEPILALLRRKLKNASVRRLLLGALLFGLVTSVYWTFSVELIAGENRLSATDRVIFWMVVGIAGVAGGLAGELVTRFGLVKVLKWATLAIATSMAILTIASDGLLMITLSAVVFGATFILITALYGIWSVSCFPEAPSTGFGLTFFLISAGQLISPTLAGVGAELWQMTGVFQVTAVCCLGIILLLPTQDVWRM
ncbi:Predicted arabinose efflux permease, MFS family [Vreelandella subterranea]|uniref:Predicted arabinose efflux permease, MFS family n=1 Tax=Vreelandella subterranea TaxID=416874 RepID=A0A1H9T9C4_9GAMM|nr:MFS transporter [Halomonas subterranea]SER93726.1 Predicted arabinose efflux permease, MFS family [Halomonas subterranea]